MRNIVNPEVVGPFLNRLIDRYPKLENYIETKVRSYILKKENTFVMEDERLGVSLFYRNLIKKLNPEEKAMYENYGVNGQYLVLTLNNPAFDDYCHWLDYAQNLSEETLLLKGFAELKKDGRKVLAAAKLIKKPSVSPLRESVDYVLVNIVGDDKLYELVSLEAYKEEGREMGHCVGSFITPSEGYKVYSLRTSEGKRIMTLRIEMSNRKLREAKGRFNSAPNHEKLNLVLEKMNFTPLTVAERKKEAIYSIFYGFAGTFIMPPIIVYFLTWNGKDYELAYVFAGLFSFLSILVLVIASAAYLRLKRKEKAI